MKKIFLVLAGMILSVAMMSAQDMQQATETYNNGVAALQADNNAQALDLFQQAMKMGEACGDTGTELVANCKKAIPGIKMSIAKAAIKNLTSADGTSVTPAQYDSAINMVNEAVKTAQEYGNIDIFDEAKTLVPQLYMQEGNDMLTAKNFAAAVAAYDKVIAADPTDGVALLRKGMALSRTESAADMAKAVEAFKQAAANGQAEAADKQLSTISLKEAANALKSGKASDALAAAKECMSYGDNPQACLVAGQAAQKLGKAEESISYFEKYLSIAPTAKNAGAITFTVAAMYQQAGNKAKALEYYQKIASDPKFGAQAAQQIAALKK